jgi:tRNA G18 (ribose-2'-O)-methylase SpoU
MHKVNLLGDGIENPLNAVVMIHAAEMFGSDCKFLDKRSLAQSWSEQSLPLPTVSKENVLQEHDLVLALDNHPGAKSLYGYRLPERSRVILVSGNERLGISKNMLDSAHDLLVIPMVSRKVNCLNVASASAVALYYLSHRFAGGLVTKSNPQKRRPELLLIGGSEHVELGSAIRSACAFGWNRVFLEDRGNVRFGGLKREARAAARRAKNEIRIVPAHEKFNYRFERATVVTTSGEGVPLHNARLADGPGQLIVIADESTPGALVNEDLQRLAAKVDFAHIEISAQSFGYNFRLPASIVMAEVARQVGQKAPWRSVPHEPLHESALKIIAETPGEMWTLEDLQQY